MKKLNLLFTALLLLCSVGTATAHDFEVGGIYYNITNDTNKTVEVTYRGSYSSYSNEYTGSVVIPEDVTYNGITYSVTSIGNQAFRDCTSLTSITIPNSVTSIGDRAFESCIGLTSIRIPNSVTSIGEYAFGSCTGLTSVEIPNSVTSIGDDAFHHCSGLTSITIPNSVTSIGRSAFENCFGLKSVEIGNSVTSIGEDAFYNCDGLTSITIPNSVTSIGDYAFFNCTGLKTVYNFSNLSFSKGSSNNGCIASHATTVYNAPNGSIEGDFIFGKPNDVNSLLYYLGNATKLTLPADYKGENYVIAADVFNGNRTIISITIPNSVTSIGERAFYNCTGLTSITIPNSVTSIGSLAFSGCSGLTSVTIGNSVTSIGSSAFESCTGFTSITIPNSVTSIGSLAFSGCSGLTSVTIGNSVTSIGSSAFESCTGFTSITIPNSVTSIGDYAFYDCDGLTSITIPNSVTSIGNYAFSSCTGLTNITVAAGNAKYDSRDNCNAIIKTETNTLITGCKNTIIPNSVTSIGEGAFDGCSGLTSITIPNSVTSIGNYAFSSCTGLKTVYNFSNLTFSKGSSNNGYIAYYATKVYNASNGSMEGDFIFGKPNDVNTLLYYLGNATELTLPADYKGENYVIAANTFNGNTTITSVEIPNSVTSVEESTFEGCTGLTAVYISDLAAWCGIDFGSADANPLYYAKNLYLNGKQLTNLTIPAGVVDVKDYTFYNCEGITNINIVDGVKTIGNSSFYGCSDLENLYISNTIESIGDYAFAECNNILDIKIGSKKAITASENVFSNDAYNNASLYVPTGRRDFYAKTSPWSNFIISEMDFTGIKDIEAEGEKGKDVYYDITGRMVENPTNGIYIINGKKVLVK